MTRQRRFLQAFIAVASLVFLGLCFLLARSLVWIVFWSLGNCGKPTTAVCNVVSWTIDYWWIPFIAIVMLAAIAARQLYRRMAGSPATV